MKDKEPSKYDFSLMEVFRLLMEGSGVFIPMLSDNCGLGDAAPLSGSGEEEAGGVETAGSVVEAGGARGAACGVDSGDGLGFASKSVLDPPNLRLFPTYTTSALVSLGSKTM
jgi:hypothetical protein